MFGLSSVRAARAAMLKRLAQPSKTNAKYDALNSCDLTSAHEVTRCAKKKMLRGLVPFV